MASIVTDCKPILSPAGLEHSETLAAIISLTAS